MRRAHEAALSGVRGWCSCSNGDTLGGVVTPAQALLTVVPQDAPVLIEAMVANDDIGFVHAGQDVEVKVKTFPYTRYGLLHGRVLDVSRDAVRQAGAGASANGKAKAQAGADDGEEDGAEGHGFGSGYVAYVALERTGLMVDGAEQKLTTGIEVVAEIKIGSRRVISYLLSPLQRRVHDGLEER